MLQNSYVQIGCKALVVAGLCVLSLWAIGVSASTEVPIAQSVPIEGEIPPTGSVVRYLEDADQYSLTSTSSDPAVYGVVGERPAIVFVSATNTVPVITRGVTVVRVDGSGGALTRGDLLTSSARPGVAQKAELYEEDVFAIALAPATFSVTDSETLLLAEVGVERARDYQRARQAEVSGDSEAVALGFVRPVVAGLLVIGGLGFLLYSFRSILAAGVQSVGRNPRARRAVIVSAVASLIFLVAVTVLILLAAIGVLVIPI